MDERCASCGACFYGDIDWCGQCLAPRLVAPLVAASRAQAGRPWEAAPAAEPPPSPLPSLDAAAASRAEGRVARSVALLLLLGVLTQAGTFAVASLGGLSSQAGLRLMVLAALIYYVVAAVAVAFHLRAGDIRPFWTRGDPRASGAVGLLTGLAGAGLVFGLQALATGELASDATIDFLVSEGTAVRIGLTILLSVGVAPLVEELLFRAAVLQGMRHRGPVPAIAVSSVLFAVFHLRPGLLYYMAGGAVFGALYWARGLKASFLAHAAFNATFVVVAIASMVGPARPVKGFSGVAAEIPAGWQEGQAGTQGDLVLSGPSGSTLVVSHDDVPAGVRLDLTAAADRLNGGERLLPGATVERGTASIEDLGTGPVLRVDVTRGGRPARVLLAPRPGRLWTVVLAHEDSPRARRDFERILGTLVLPGHPGPANP